MKVLYATRLFSGLERSIRERRWVPTGVPTIYKVIEALDRETDDLVLLFAAKDGHTSWDEREDLEVKLEGMSARVYVLAGGPQLPRPLRPLASAWREIRHAAHILRAARRENPDVIYIDHGNLWAAGLIARLLPTPVVFRVMGIYPAMREALEGGGVAHRYMRWCYRAPYAAVICSEDGSGVDPWLARAIRPGVAVHKLMNGVDAVPAGSGDPRVSCLSPDRIVALFLGKLEHTKGAFEFAQGFLLAAAAEPRLHALMIGTGKLANPILRKFSDAQAADRLTLIEQLPHAHVLSALKRADIYVSLNRFGNLSNANLEAMRVGLCMVLPRSQPATAVDLATDALMPPATAWRIESADDVDGLAKALTTLARDPYRRRTMADSVRAIADRSIGGWHARIARELDILRSAASGQQERT
jgi:glycosyltransferase involved in cell wall biosynthesis